MKTLFASVIVYRSRFEQQNDEFWFDLFNNNPDMIIGIGKVLIGAISGWLGFLFCAHIYHRFKPKQYGRYDHSHKKGFR